ncbi:MAG: Zn-ribbon domain-containing OB-fold protein [Halobacteriota archaeon]
MSDGDEPVRDGIYDDFLDAVEKGEGYYLDTGEDVTVPPGTIVPETEPAGGDERPLPEEGEIRSYTVIHAAHPAFAHDAPYVVAIADLGPVRVTGQVRGVEAADVDVGMTVHPTVESTGDRRFLAFEPATE